MIPNGVRSLDFSRDGHLLAVASGTELSVFDMQTRLPLWACPETATPSIVTNGFSSVTKYCMSIDSAGARIAVGLPDGGIRLRDARSGADQGQFAAHPYPVTCVRFSPDGSLLASSGMDRSIAIWNPVARTEIARMRGHTQPVLCLAFSPDGSVLASAAEESRDADNDMSIRLWDVRTGRHLRTLSGHEGGVFTIVFSHDGQRLYSGSRDEMIREWDVASGAPLQVHRGHSGDVAALSVSPDGRRLVSCSNDNTVRLWDLETGQQVFTIRLEARPAAPIVEFGPNGMQLAAGTNEGYLLWDAAPRNQNSSETPAAPGE